MNEKLKLKVLLITLFTFNFLFSQNFENIERNVRIGKEIKDNPILWVVIYKSDTLEIQTKNYEIIEKQIAVENIESIDVLKDKTALERYPELGKNGVIIMILKAETTNWGNIKFNLIVNTTTNKN